MPKWYVLVTKARCERKVAACLTRNGFEIYCPLVKSVRQWSDRKKKVSLPLFTSYLFVRLEEAERDNVFCCSGIARYLFWLGKPAVVTDNEIKSIKDFLLTHGEKAEITINHYRVGQRVKVKSGLFAETEGEIIRKSQNKVVLSISSMGAIVQAELHHSLLV